MKNKLIIVVISTVIATTFYPAFSFANGADNGTANDRNVNEEACEISSLQELEQEIEKADEDNKISKSEAHNILSETDPAVMEEYIKEIDNMLSEEIENNEPDETYYNPGCDKTTEIYNLKIDGLTSVELEIVDQEEQAPVCRIASKIRDVVIPSAFAASNGEKLWKEYGNRYFTAKYTRCIGPGYCTMRTENHYKVSSSGITERYGDSWIADSTALFTTVSGPTDIITKKTATSVNAYAHMKTTLRVTMIVNGVVRTYDLRERTGIQYLAKDSANKRIKVKHYWKSLD